MFGQVLVGVIAGEDAVPAIVPEVAAVGWSFDAGLWEPGWHSYAARTRFDRSDVEYTHVVPIDCCAAACWVRMMRIRIAPWRIVVEPLALPGT